jgi:K+-transporting ATPase ATPase A chain
VLYAVLLILVTKPLGLYMWRVFDGQRTFLTPVVGPLERGIYRLSSVHPESEQGWVGYAFAMLIFSVVGGLLTYAIERLQNVLPFNA